VDRYGVIRDREGGQALEKLINIDGDRGCGVCGRGWEGDRQGGENWRMQKMTAMAYLVLSIQVLQIKTNHAEH
jgi:hypothetical protein